MSNHICISNIVFVKKDEPEHPPFFAKGHGDVFLKTWVMSWKMHEISILGIVQDVQHLQEIKKHESNQLFLENYLSKVCKMYVAYA